MNNNICSALWNHQFVDGTGRIKPCCRFESNNVRYFKDTIEGNFFSEEMSELRAASLRGERISGCVRCNEEEDNGKKSLRQRYNENQLLGNVNVDEPKIQWLELAISNECNIKCRMCDSKYSDKWYEEELALKGSAIKTTKIDIRDVYPFVPTLKHLKITGGEPFVTPDHWRLLDYIIESGYSKNIFLNYSTNCTVYPKAEIVDRLKQFKHVELVVSMDSIHKDEFEYLRFPSDYTAVIKNIEKFISLQNEFDLRLQARPTISIFNVLHLPETLEWLKDRNIKFNTTHLSFPDFLSITVLSKEAKQFIADKFEKFEYSDDIIRSQCDYIIKLMLSRDDSHLQNKFLRITNFLDNSRNQDYKKIYSYLR